MFQGLSRNEKNIPCHSLRAWDKPRGRFRFRGLGGGGGGGVRKLLHSWLSLASFLRIITSFSSPSFSCSTTLEIMFSLGLESAASGILKILRVEYLQRFVVVSLHFCFWKFSLNAVIKSFSSLLKSVVRPDLETILSHNFQQWIKCAYTQLQRPLCTDDTFPCETLFSHWMVKTRLSQVLIMYFQDGLTVAYRDNV